MSVTNSISGFKELYEISVASLLFGYRKNISFSFSHQVFSSSNFGIVEPYQLIEAEVNHVSNYLAQFTNIKFDLIVCQTYSRDNIQNKHKADCLLHFFCAYTGVGAGKLLDFQEAVVFVAATGCNVTVIGYSDLKTSRRDLLLLRYLSTFYWYL